MTKIFDPGPIRRRHTGPLEPDACGTCRRLVVADQPAEHPECVRRAMLVPAPDAPGYEAIGEMTEAERKALRPRFHTPSFVQDSTPKAWVCAVCWGDGWVTAWPCEVALEFGHLVFTPEHQAETIRADLTTLVYEAVTARAAGYRNAYDNAADMVANHGKDADREMVLLHLERGAELREHLAQNHLTHTLETS